MNTRNLILLFSLILISLASCRKDTLTTEMTTIPTEPETNIESTLNGFITDRNGAPIEEAQVTILNAFTVTDEFGFFEIKGLVNDKFAVIKVEKSGYFDQIKTLVPSKTITSRTRIQLTEKGSPETFNSSNGGEISIDQNSSVQFQANSIVDEQGNAYNGNVNVYSFYIDPTHADLDQIMPGNLMARNTNNELQVLESYGMVNVILEGDGGQKLNINKTATLTTDVPSSILNTAPAEIPLWHFDEEKGLWMEEGKAVLQNGKYVGEVEHFTFWNCDVPGEFTQITGQIFDNKGVATLNVRITDVATGASFSSWTNEIGGFDGFVPQNVNLLLEILDICGTTVLFSENIGPFTSDVEDLGIFNISSSTDFSLVTGTLVDCDLQPIENGIVYFKITTHSFYEQTTTNAAGEFSALIPTCDLSEIELSGVDPNTELVSATQTLQITPNIDAGNVIVCTSINPTLGEVIISIDGFAPKVFDNCTVSIQGNGYVFTYYEDLGATDTIFYYFSIVNGTGDINSPIWQTNSSFFAYGPPANASSDLTFTAYTGVKTSSSSVVTVNQVGENIGEILDISMENVSVKIKEYDANGPDPWTTYPNSNVSLSAVIIEN
ncbi:MAG: carboxypeptidase-like regulatory domain-containing protein [Saprospiraceae bacterium]